MRSPETENNGGRGVPRVMVITVGVAIAVAAILVIAVFTANSWPAQWPTIRSSLYDYWWWLVLAGIVAVALLVLWLLNKLLQRPWGAPWRVKILAAADALHYELEALLAEARPEEQALRRSVGEAVEHHLDVARKAAWPEQEKRLTVGAQFLD